MDNHVHWIVTPSTAKGLARLFQRVHTWWAVVFNRRYERTGHLFQNRYHSSPLDEKHYWEALRYVELNPKKAGLVLQADEWDFSSARTHLTGRSENSGIRLSTLKTRRQFPVSEWRTFLGVPNREADQRLRRATAGSRPCGDDDWVAGLERDHQRKLAWSPPGCSSARIKTLSAS